MDAQSLINIFTAIAGFFGGWVINSLTKSITRIEDRLQEMPAKYVAKDDYRRDIDEIKVMLKGIFDKLDHKADK
jgi:hypothetical protein